MGRHPDELMLPTTGLTTRQLTSVLEPAFLEPRPAGRKLLASSAQVVAGGEEAPPPPAVSAPARPRRRVSVQPPKHSATRHGWSDLLGEISESSRRVRVARGGRIGSASAQPGLPALKPEPAELEAAPPAPAAAKRRPVAAGTATGPASTGGTGAATSSSAPAPLPPPPAAPSPQPPATGTASSSSAPAPRPPPPAAPTPKPPATGTNPAAASSSRPPAAAPVPPGTSPQPVREEEIWQSYRIDEEKVPDSTLALLWRRALDRKCCEEAIVPLPRVPRLTVTRREVQQLPPVHDIEHLRQANRRRREQRKLREESEHYPNLEEMLRTIFGDQSPPRLRFMQLKSTMQNFMKNRQTMSSVARWVSSRSSQANEEVGISELQAEVRTELQQEVAAEEAKLPAHKGFCGTRKKGRRNAIDMGPPTGQPLAVVPEGEKTQGRTQDTKLMQGLEALRAASGPGEKLDKALEKVTSTSKKVQDRCQRKVQRMHDRFLQKKGQLSGRLQRRVQRLQMDFQEIHDEKVNLILPGSVASACETSPGHGQEGSEGDHTVLTYLKRQRHHVERARQSRHATYLQQVDRFQSHLRLLADPNRAPERGEVYLSECFRHVLSAGLIVDNDYFFRVLSNLEAEDFEKAATVNLLAACCDAFGIDLKRYWALLKVKGLPMWTLRQSPEKVQSWNDCAPWCGVALEDARELLEQLLPTSDESGDSGDDLPVSARDPLPFGPIMPTEIPTSSELVSREDPLKEILDAVALDAVLERYHLGKASRDRGASASGSADEGSAAAADSGEEACGASSGEARAAAQAPSTSRGAAGEEPRPALGAGAAASEARRDLSARIRRPPLRGYPTLRSARGLGESLAARAAGASSERAPPESTLPAKQPSLRPVPERPGLPLEHEYLE